MFVCSWLVISDSDTLLRLCIQKLRAPPGFSALNLRVAFSKVSQGKELVLSRLAALDFRCFDIGCWVVGSHLVPRDHLLEPPHTGQLDGDSSVRIADVYQVPAINALGLPQ